MKRLRTLFAGTAFATSLAITRTTSACDTALAAAHTSTASPSGSVMSVTTMPYCRDRMRSRAAFSVAVCSIL